MTQSFSFGKILLVLGLSFSLLGAVDARAADGVSPLTQAEQAYQTGDYGQTIDLLEQHLSSDETTPLTQVTAYRLLALAHLAGDDTASARAATDNLVRVFPTYERGAEDTDAFATLVSESQQRYANGELVREKKKQRIPQFVYNTVTFVTSAVVLYVGAKSM